MDSKLKDFITKLSEIENVKLYVKNCVEFNHNGAEKDTVAVRFRLKNLDTGNFEGEYIVYAKDMDELIRKINKLETEYFSEYEIEKDF